MLSNDIHLDALIVTFIWLPSVLSSTPSLFHLNIRNVIHYLVMKYLSYFLKINACENCKTHFNVFLSAGARKHKLNPNNLTSVLSRGFQTITVYCNTHLLWTYSNVSICFLTSFNRPVFILDSSDVFRLFGKGSFFFLRQ